MQHRVNIWKRTPEAGEGERAGISRLLGWLFIPVIALSLASCEQPVTEEEPAANGEKEEKTDIQLDEKDQQQKGQQQKGQQQKGQQQKGQQQKGQQQKDQQPPGQQQPKEQPPPEQPQAGDQQQDKGAGIDLPDQQ